MRQFYLEYHDLAKFQPLVGEIGWTHNLVIMGRCKDHLEREFYIRMVRKFGWSKNVLIHQIENQSYEKAEVKPTARAVSFTDVHQQWEDILLGVKFRLLALLQTSLLAVFTTK